MPYALVLSSHLLVVVCRVATIALSSCAALSSSRCTCWLLHVAPLCPPFFLHCLLVFLSCWLVVACRIASVALSCYAAFVSSRHACAALSPSHGACWLLCVTTPLSPYRLGPPSLALGALSYCAALSPSHRLCRLIMLRRTLTSHHIGGCCMSILSMGFFLREVDVNG